MLEGAAQIAQSSPYFTLVHLDSDSGVPANHIPVIRCPETHSALCRILLAHELEVKMN